MRGDLPGVRAWRQRLLRPVGSVDLPALIPLLHRDGMAELDTERFLRTVYAAAFGKEPPS